MRLKSFSDFEPAKHQVRSRRLRMPPLEANYVEEELKQPIGKVVDVDPIPSGLLIALVAFVCSLVVLIVGLLSYLL